MSESAPKEICPECGLEIPAGSGCPGCSLRLALSPDSVTPLVAKRPPPPGLKSAFFGNYEILNELARGGMGVVYRARQLGLNRLVALKMVQSSQLLSDEARLRFRVEIEAVAQLNHPHIVALYESGEQEGTHFFTMRLVEGGDLAAQLKRERPLRERIQLLVKVCRAVHYAHQRGILHRDLKPSNILVDSEGEPHVADFGLAKSLDQDSGFTFTSSVLGSPNYMAPEQATGKTRQITTAVDVYGLGAILYHILAGRPPFQAKTPIETLRQVVDNDPNPPRSTNPQADRDLETIALKCLRKEPGARYGTAEEVAQDLERWLAGDPILARPLGPFAAVWRWSRRHPAAAMLGAALVLALTAIVVGTGIAAVRIQRAEQKAAGHLRESLLREASSLRLGSDLGHRDEGLRLIREAVALGGSPEFRLQARNELLATMSRIEPQFLPAGTTNVNAKPELNAVHPDFLIFASVEHETNLVLRGIDDGAFRNRFVSTNGPITRVEAFSPAGLFLALRHPGTLTIWEVQSGQQCLAFPGTNLTFAFHPRENALVIEDAPYNAVWLDLPSGQERFRWTAPPQRLKGSRAGWQILAFSPDGRVLAGAAGNTRLLEFINPETGQQVGLITNSQQAVAMTWKSGGDSLAVATADGKVSIWNPRTGALQWSSPAMIAEARSLAFHPHRDWLVAACRDGKLRFIDTFQQRFVFEYETEYRRIAFSPHGTRLGPVWSQGQMGWLGTSRAEAFTSFGLGRWMQLTDGAFSPDGKVLAVGDFEAVVVCNPRLGRRVEIKSSWRMTACAFHPRENLVIASDENGLSQYAYDLAVTRLTLSPLGMLHPGAQWNAVAFTPDAQRFAAFNGQSNAVFVFDHTLTNRLSSFGPHPDAETLALSPDGRWAATGSRDGAIRIWDVSAQRLELNLRGGFQPRSAFSSDGRWFAISGTRFQLLHAGTWKPAPPLPINDKSPILGAAAFSPDSRMLALIVNRFEVHLFDLQTFKSLGILRPPGTIQIMSLVFSPDGSQLAATGAEARVAVWNMQEIEKNLMEFGLGWELSDAKPVR